jgi:O-antigen/teichoic acid export membrane protein
VYANGVALVLNAGLSSALGFIFWMVAARRFNADALGLGAAVVSAATLAALIGKAGFDAAIVRYAPSASPAQLGRLLARASAATLALTGVTALALLLIAKLGVPALAPLAQPAFAGGFVALALGTSFAWVLDAYYISEQRASVVLLRNVAFNLVKLGVPLFIAFSLGGRAVPLAWGIGLIASLVVAIALLPGALKAHRQQGDMPERGALGYSMRNYAINLSEFLPGLVLPIVVLHALGAEENARFFLAWTIATVAFLASKAIAQSAFAALVRDPDGRAPLRKAVGLSAALLLPPALVLYLAAPQLLGLFGEHYVAAAALLRVLALSVPFVIATNLYLACLKAHDAGWELTLLPLASLVALLALAPFALNKMGIEGLGLAWLAVQATVGTYAAARLVAKLRRDLDVREAEPKLGTRLRHRPHEG